MERPTILVKQEKRGNNLIYSLTISHGRDTGSAVVAEFVDVAMKHSLPPEGGCFEVNAHSIDRGTVHFLGGVYVQSEKLHAVLSDLRSRGYKIEHQAAA